MSLPERDEKCTKSITEHKSKSYRPQIKDLFYTNYCSHVRKLSRKCHIWGPTQPFIMLKYKIIPKNKPAAQAAGAYPS